MLYKNLIKEGSFKRLKANTDYPLALYWAIKMVMSSTKKPNKAPRRLASNSGDYGEFREELEAYLGYVVDYDAEEEDKIPIQVLCKEGLKSLTESLDSTHKPSEQLENNIRTLGRALNLSKLEQKILLLAALSELSPALNYVFEQEKCTSFSHAYRCFALLLDEGVADVEDALLMQSSLMSLHIISSERDINANSTLDEFFPLMGESHRALSGPFVNVAKYMSKICSEVDGEGLGMASYQHLQPALGDAQRTLSSGVSQRSAGVNVLLYGPPGTGKTQLATTLCRAIGCSLNAVSARGKDAEAIPATERRGAYMRSQRFLSNRENVVLMFDEVEDVFPSGDNLFMTTEDGVTKAWWNQALEQNAVPMIWISNKISQLDPALVRRFDVVLEVPVPPTRVREQIVRQYVNGLSVSDNRICQLAKHKDLSPAHIARASAVVKRTSTPVEDQEQMLVRLLESSQRALSTPMKMESAVGRLPYDSAMVNCSRNIDEVRTGIGASQSARLLMYGPPGTGKSAWARHLADSLNIELMVRRSSDLLSKWVGGTEKNIANAFREARENKALLLIDEVDSLLFQRADGMKTWEVGQVNEFLTHLESFDGVVACTTNRLEGVDSAALRRFDFKLRFGYMSVDQAEKMIDLVLDSRGKGLSNRSVEVSKTLASLKQLTPGDFPIALRRLEIGGQPWGADELINELVLDDADKPSDGFSKPIGFTV